MFIIFNLIATMHFSESNLPKKSIQEKIIDNIKYLMLDEYK